tara:strand:- start:2222 stop:4138 length:1917 start_codon:yes stop_codon:yes gene_type:complete
LANPFEKRASEYRRDDEAFLPLVTPDPLITFFKKHADDGKLYDQLSVIIGAPGSGKTTIARLYQYATLNTLLQHESQTNFKPLVDTLTQCGAIKNREPVLLGGRVPLESEYREFWEFPYPDELKCKLMFALIQSRTVLAWISNVMSTGVKLEQISIVPRGNAKAALAAIGGRDGKSLFDKARSIEEQIYNISAALLPPKIDDIEEKAAAAYHPFDVIEYFEIETAGDTKQLRPLVIFDDAHSLHPEQFSAFRQWLARRELKISRWVLTRMDALSPADVLLAQGESNANRPGLKNARELTVIWMQSQDDRPSKRKAFRKMAKGMASRYLGQMDVFSRRRIQDLADFTSSRPEPLPPSKLEALANTVNTLQHKNSISSARRKKLEGLISDYLSNTRQDGDDVALAMLSILLHRYLKRIPQKGLFDEQDDDVEPNRPLTVDGGIADGARVRLLHDFGRPYYYDIDALCDASSENAEQFLHLASTLVTQAETQLIRGKSASLTCRVQNRLLRAKAGEIYKEWDFPHSQQVAMLAEGIAAQCLAKTLEGNASLGGGAGAGAFGIPQEEFDEIPKKHEELARVLKFGAAYNAFVLVQNHSTKHRNWCQIELSGVLRVHFGLSQTRGGFLERTTDDLLAMLKARR